MSKKEIVRVVPADPRPESIANVFAVSRITTGGFSGCNQETCRLSGTVEEKLAQYKEFFGEDWAGTAEQTYTEYEEDESKFVPLFGEYVATSMMHPAFIKAKEEIEALAIDANETLAWNEEMKASWPKRKAAIAKKELRTTRKQLVDVLGE